jgi:hypothetical protein
VKSSGSSTGAFLQEEFLEEKGLAELDSDDKVEVAVEERSDIFETKELINYKGNFKNKLDI